MDGFTFDLQRFENETQENPENNNQENQQTDPANTNEGGEGTPTGGDGGNTQEGGTTQPATGGETETPQETNKTATKEIDGITYTYDSTEVVLNNDGKTFVYDPNKKAEAAKIIASVNGTTVATYTLSAEGQHIIVGTEDSNTAVTIGGVGVKVTVNNKDYTFGAGSAGDLVVFDSNKTFNRITAIPNSIVTIDGTEYQNTTTSTDAKADRNVHFFFTEGALSVIALSGIKDTTLKAGEKTTYTKTGENGTTANVIVNADGSLNVNTGVKVALDRDSYEFSGNANLSGSLRFDSNNKVDRIGLNDGVTVTASGTHTGTFAALGANVSVCYDVSEGSTATYYFALAAGATATVGADDNKKTYKCELSGATDKTKGLATVDFDSSGNLVNVTFLKGKATNGTTVTTADDVTYKYTGENAPAADLNVTLNNDSGLVTVPENVEATGLTPVTVDDKTAYYLTEEKANTAIASYTKVLIDGTETTKYYSTKELADKAVENCVATITTTDEETDTSTTVYYTTKDKALAAVADNGTIDVIKADSFSGLAGDSEKTFTVAFEKYSVTLKNDAATISANEAEETDEIVEEDEETPAAKTPEIIKIPATLFADSITKISAAGNETAVSISGGSAVTSIEGGEAGDTLSTANKTSATFTGGKGNDLFVYGGSGALTITDYNNAEGDSDTISVTSNVTGISTTNEGKDAVLTFGKDKTITLTEIGDKIITVTKNGTASYYSKNGTLNADQTAITLTAEVTTYAAGASIATINGSKTTKGVTIDGSAVTGGVTITGGEGNDQITGSTGNDKFTGGKGDDLFVYSGGKDTITDYGTGNDKISLDNAEVSAVSTSGNNLILSLGDDSQIVLTGAASKTITIAGDEDKTTLYTKDGELAEDGITLSSATKTYTAPSKSEIVTIDGSATDGVNITGNKLNNLIIGGEGDDTLNGGDGDDTLGALGGTNKFTGGKGNDLFVVGAGGGTITDYTAGEDSIYLEQGLDLETATFEVKGNNVILTFGSEEEPENPEEEPKVVDEPDLADEDTAKTVTLTLTNAKGKTITFVGEDEENPTLRTYTADGALEADGKVTLDESFKGKSYDISKSTTVNEIDASKVKAGVNLIGNGGVNEETGNTLTGGEGNDTLTSGTGDDELTGGKGNDLFIYSGGEDTIKDYSSKSGDGETGADTIKIAKNFTIEGADFSGSDVVFTLKGKDDKATNKITVTGAKADTITVIDASNKTWTYTGDYTAQGNGVTLQTGKKDFDASPTDDAWKKTIVTIDGSAGEAGSLIGNDKGNVITASTTIDKDATGVTLSGGKGNDTLTGSKGKDYFVFTEGKDFITNYETGTDTVSLAGAEIGEITSFKKSGKNDVLTVGKNTITFIDGVTEVSIIDSKNKTADLSTEGVITETGGKKELKMFNGVKTLASSDGFDSIDASEVGNATTITGGTKDQSVTAGKGADTFIYASGASSTMTILNYAENDKISIDGSFTTAVDSATKDVTLTVKTGEETGTIVIKDAAGKAINIHDESNKTGQYTAHVYYQDGVSADKSGRLVTIDSGTYDYEVGDKVTQITYQGGAVTLTDFNEKKTKVIVAGDLKLDDINKVEAGKLTFATTATEEPEVDLADATEITEKPTEEAPAKTTGTNTLSFTNTDKEAGKKINISGTVTDTKGKPKTVSQTLYLGDNVLYNNDIAKATNATVFGSYDASTTTDAVKLTNITVSAAVSDAVSIKGNKNNNTITANDKGGTLDGGTGNDVLIGSTVSGSADVFVHDKITGTTTIKNYEAGETVSLESGLSVVGSAYSAGNKSGTLTLTVQGTDDDGKTKTSKIVINSADFNKTDAKDYGEIGLEVGGTDESGYFGKNAVYNEDGDEVGLLANFSGKYTAASSLSAITVDGSAVTKNNVWIVGTGGDDELTAGKGKKNTLTGGKGGDKLTGNEGSADVFVYAKGDGEDVIADFTYNEDKLKVSTAKLIDTISYADGKLTFGMNDDDSGSVEIGGIQEKFVIKANNKIYWFETDSEDSTKTNLVTSSKNTSEMNTILKDKTGTYAVVELDYGTKLTDSKYGCGAIFTDGSSFKAENYKITPTPKSGD